MKYELQLDILWNSWISFGDSFPIEKLEDWIINVTKKYNGTFLETLDRTMYLEFSNLYDAHMFFYNIHNKLAPRLSFLNPTGSMRFIDPNYNPDCEQEKINVMKNNF
jgi:hypothetical protein